MPTTSGTGRLAGVLGATLPLTLVTVAPASAAGAFWDDDGDVHEENIEGLAEADVTMGCDPPANSQYCGFDVVERGHMAAFLARALDLPPTDDDHFVDDEDSIFEESINRIAAAGITTGCNPPENDRYCPEEPVRRDQMAKFLANGYDVPTSEDDAFADDDQNIFEPHINGIEDAGITMGCNPPENDRYCPDDDVRRNAMASFLARADEDIDGLDPMRLHERRVTYTVNSASQDVEQRHLDLVRRRANEAFYAEDGWNIRHRLLFSEVEGHPDFHIMLASDEDIADASPTCSEGYSCTVGDVVYINRDNFLDRPATWEHRTQAEYQRYVLQHEVGHFLDFDETADADDDSHYNDEKYCVDGDAPVMKQQSIDPGSCDTNVYPLPFERDCVEEAWLPDTTNQGDGDGDISDQCPHEPTER